MKLLLVSEYFYPYGGAELSLWKLCGALVARGHAISVVTSRRSGEAEHEVKEGIEVFRPFATGNLWSRFLFASKLYPYLSRWLKGRDIDIVYNLGYVPTLPATYAARKHKVPAVTLLGHLCGTGWFRLVNPLLALFNWTMEKFTIRFGRHRVLVAQCQESAQKVAGGARAEVAVICNTFLDGPLIEKARTGTDVRKVRESLGIEEGSLFLLMAGGLIPTKNIPATIKALAGWQKPYRLVLAGEGPQRGKIERLIKQEHLDDRVVLAGRKPHGETLALMRACDVLLLTSLCEQVPNVVLEALALGRPIIATRVGGVPGITSANLHLIDRLEEIRDILDSGIQAAEEDTIGEDYSLEKVAGQYEALFDRLAREKTETVRSTHGTERRTAQR
jgi:glycosyltransferase involved in cell wall biosynthesis